MLHHYLILASEVQHGSSGFGLNLGTLLSGIAALIVALGSGLGSFLRYRKTTQRVRDSAQDEAITRAQTAEARLTRQYEERIAHLEATRDHLEEALDAQRHMYEDRLSNLQNLTTMLVSQILEFLQAPPHGHED